MTRSPLWREFESSDNIFLWLLRALILGGGFAFLVVAGILELTWQQQSLLGAITLVVAICMNRASASYLVTLTLILLSCFSTFRYGYWRISTVIKFFTDPLAQPQWTVLDAFFVCLLLGAECYAFAVLFMGYLQTLWPLRRTPVPLPDDTDLWPEVDLLIPTYNEPLTVVRYTALAAMNIDWPADRLNVYILDDGRREEFRTFAEEAGIGYMTREDNAHAKAGNINHALERLDAPFVAIFDSDHVPTRSFLQLTMGWFGRDAKLGLMQTPHHLYSPDPFERNLGQFRVIPNEGELFYGVVQDGNDFWNATFFCGSCAVIRRSALDEIGGMAVETVTEDAHTSLRMQMRGWNTAYINIPQAAGLATERLSGHVKQRIRWARGMVQILRIDNPLFAPGLNSAQRLCYFNAMMHFLYALPRLVFLTAPLIYLVLGRTSFPGYWATILAYALPHLLLLYMTNSRIQGQYRHSFWNEIYETVMAPYILLPTLLALVNPKLGSFNVTAKGGVVNRSFFDTRIAQPFLCLLGINVVGLLCAIPRLFKIPARSFQPLFSSSKAVLNWVANLPNILGQLPHNMYDGAHPGTILMNVLWTLFNITILGVVTAVAWESQQRRQMVRVAMRVPADILMPDGTAVESVTTDLSGGGVMLLTKSAVSIPVGTTFKLVFPVLDGEATLPAIVVGVDGRTLRAHFDALTMQEEEALTMVLYSRADTWVGWGQSRERDKPLASLWRILKLSFHGLIHTAPSLMTNGKNPSKTKLATSILPMALGMAILPGMMPHVKAQGLAAPTQATTVPAQAPGAFDKVFTLADVGQVDTILLRGVDAHHTVSFAVPQIEVVKTATLKLRYHFSPGLIPKLSHLNLSLNGSLIATLPVEATSENSGLLETTLALPANMLVHRNALVFEFIGHYTEQCEDPSHSTLWSRIDATSSIELQGSLLPLQNELKLLPLPFYDAAVNLHPSVPIVFLSQPSLKAMQAAGIVTSWFGILTGSHAVRFPVTIGSTLPLGNAIVISENVANLPPGLGIGGTSGPTIAMEINPSDPYSKLLVLTGINADELLVAAKVLALQSSSLAGDRQTVGLKDELKRREPDDAPRWLRTDRITTLGEMAKQGDLEGEGSAPVDVYFRTPPDLYYGARQNLALRLNYRYSGIPLTNDSALQLSMNGAYVNSAPMPHTDNASADLSTLLPVPVVDMRPFSNSMKMEFAFQMAKKGGCVDVGPANLQGAILKSSSLDLRAIPHWAAMPNLQIFANAGYPFTRIADLADTAVVLPDQPSSEEIEMFLTLMGHFGAQTGYPVLNVTVTNADGMKAESGKDYLLMGTADGLKSALAKVSDSLPVKVSGSGLEMEDTHSLLPNAWWKMLRRDRAASGKLEISGGALPDALVEGLEWPRGSGKSVVLIALREKSMVPNFLSTFLQDSQTSDISQSVSVLKGERFVSDRIGSDAYHVGSLSWWTQTNLWFSEFPGMLIGLVLLVCFLMAALLAAILRRRARRRLLGLD